MYLQNTQEKSYTQFDAEDELSDQDHNECLALEFSNIQVFPVNLSKVAKPALGGTPAKGRDPRAPMGINSKCKGCKHSRARDDWEHNRVIG